MDEKTYQAELQGAKDLYRSSLAWYSNMLISIEEERAKLRNQSEFPYWTLFPILLALLLALI